MMFSKHKKATILLALALVVVTVLLIVFLTSQKTTSISLIDQFPRSSTIYDGFTIEMDGTTMERFALAGGFALPEKERDSEDSSARDVEQQFGVRFERWQMVDISIRLRLKPQRNHLVLDVSLNGEPISQSPLTSGYQEIVVKLPNELLVRGLNVLEFALPGSNKEHSATLDYIRWEVGIPNLGGKIELDERASGSDTVAVMGSASNAEIGFYMEVPDKARLRLGLGHDRDDIIGSAGVLKVLCVNEDGSLEASEEFDFPQQGMKQVEMDLSEFGGKLCLISILFSPNPMSADWYYISEPQLVSPKADTLKDDVASDDEAVTLVSPLDEAAPRTIVIICEDACRTDYLPMYGNTIIKTPHLDRYAQSGVVYENAYSHSSWTKPSFSAMFTGMPSTITGTEKPLSMLNEGIDTLASQLSANQWRTCMISANRFTGESFGLTRGFDNFVDLVPPDQDIDNPTKAYAGDFLPHVADWLSSLRADEDAFIVLHMMDTHSPYSPPEDFPDLYAAQVAGLLENNNSFHEGRDRFTSTLGNPPEVIIPEFLQYCSSITYFDSILPKLTRLFADSQRVDNTMFIFLADHGEEFFDHGAVRHGGTLYQEVIDIPLIVWGKGIESDRIEAPVSLMDIMPTVLTTAQLPVAETLWGSPLPGLFSDYPADNDRVLFAQTELFSEHGTSALSVIDGDWKLIQTPARYQLYDLAEDNGELDSIASAHQVRMGYLRGLLQEWWASANPQGSVEGRTAVLDENMASELRGLGYLQ